MTIQLIFPTARIAIMEAFNFGYGLEFESYHYSSIRPSGTFQSYDIASIFLTTITLLRTEKILDYSKILIFITILFIVITARTGILLLLIYLTFKNLKNLTIALITFFLLFHLINKFEPTFLEPYFWLKDDILHEIKALNTQLENISLFGNRLPPYNNNSISDVGYEHILLTYGIIGLFILTFYYIHFIFRLTKKLRIIFFIVLFVGSFKTNLFTPTLFLFFTHFILFATKKLKYVR